MRSLLLFTTVLSAIPMAVSEAVNLQVVPTVTQPAALARRQDLKCSSSVGTELAAPTPDDELIQWVATEGIAAFDCTVTAPASLYSEYNRWQSQMTDWAENLEKNAHKQPKCGFATFSVDTDGICLKSHTAIFTDASGDEATSEVYPPLPLKTDIMIGAAPQHTGTVGAGIALAGFVAIVLAL